MNLRRGLLRLWIVLSALWIVFAIWRFWTSCVPGSDGWLWCSIGDDDWIAELRYFGWRDAVRLALWLLGPPVACFVLGAIGLWVGNGFSRSANSN
jgi:hypothetical protein